MNKPSPASMRNPDIPQYRTRNQFTPLCEWRRTCQGMEVVSCDYCAGVVTSPEGECVIRGREGHDHDGGNCRRGM